VLAALLVLIATQVTRLVVPGRGPYPWTLLLSAAGLIGGEIVAGSGYLAFPAIGVVHPVADAVVIAVLQAGGAYVTAPENPAGRSRR
jgi:hypothetical protein